MVFYVNYVEGKLIMNDEQCVKDLLYNIYLYNGLLFIFIDNFGVIFMEVVVILIKSDYFYWVVIDFDKGIMVYFKMLVEYEKNVKKF